MPDYRKLDIRLIKYTATKTKWHNIKILRKDITSADLFDKAIRKNMMIRDCSTFPFLDNKYIRFCFMMPEMNDKLIDCLLSK